MNEPTINFQGSLSCRQEVVGEDVSGFSRNRKSRLKRKLEIGDVIIGVDDQRNGMVALKKRFGSTLS
jgi:hypothetical protein